MRELAAVLPESAGQPSRVGGDSAGGRGGKAGPAGGLPSRGARELRPLGLHPAPGGAGRLRCGLAAPAPRGALFATGRPEGVGSSDLGQGEALNLFTVVVV